MWSCQEEKRLVVMLRTIVVCKDVNDVNVILLHLVMSSGTHRTGHIGTASLYSHVSSSTNLTWWIRTSAQMSASLAQLYCVQAKLDRGERPRRSDLTRELDDSGSTNETSIRERS